MLRRIGLDAALAATLALLVVPILDAVAVDTGIVSGTAGLLVAGGAVLTFAASIAALRIAAGPELVERVDGWWALPLLAAPVLAFAGFLLAVVSNDAFDPALAAGALSIVPGGIAVGLAHWIAVDRRLASTTERLSFEARPAARTRAIATGGIAALLAVAAVGWIAVVATGVDPLSPVDTVVPAVGGLTAATAAVYSERAVTVTDDGVLVAGSFVEWDDFESFAVTEDAVVLRRSGWRRGHTFDAEDLEDSSTLASVLSEYLPEAGNGDR